ncbi:oligosaccharide flippase family protein [Fictibacillus sp. FJAT-27399]|uniref:oligosaccharide flippase family protein n=1 Tax=Fictibacillus sp. FJAT-27399 TaxID=1729689 RepID=UPI000782E603|nr:oligosaccharide flippase family protein [Fictibacillus sp. FJAT-27399]
MNDKLILKNASFLFSSDVLVRLISSVAAILVARHLGSHGYGILSVGMAFTAIAAYFTDMGLTHTFIREGTKPNVKLDHLISSFFKTRIVFALGTALVSIIIIRILYTDTLLIRQVLYVMVLPTILGSALQGVGVVYFQVTSQMKYTAFIRGLSGLITAGSLLVGITSNWSLLLISSVYGCSSILGGVTSVLMVTKRISLLHGWNQSILRGIISFTLGGIVVLMLPQLGPLVLERVTSFQQVGYYAAAIRIPIVLYQVPGVLATAFYPLLFEYGNKNQKENHLKLNIFQLKLMSTLGIIMAIPFLFYPTWWITFLFGDEWIASSRVLAILSCMVILQSINYPLADALTTKGLQKRRTLTLLVALFVGLVSYISLGSRLGSIGGGFSAIIIEIILMIGFTISNPSGFKLISCGIRYNFISLFFIIVIGFFVLVNISPFIGIPICILIFLCLSVSLDREIRKWILSKIKIKRKEGLL